MDSSEALVEVEKDTSYGSIGYKDLIEFEICGAMKIV